MKSKSKLLLKSVSALTAGAVMMTLTACSGLSEKVEEVVEEAAVPGSITAYAEEAGAPVVDKKSRGWVSEYGNLRLDMPQTHLDPAQVYGSLEYTKDFFIGEYHLEDMYLDGQFQYKGDQAQKFLDSHKTFESQYYNGKKMTYLPVSLEITAYNNEIRLVREKYDNDDEAYATSIYGECEVKGNQLVFTPKDSYKIDEPLVYDFSFRGTHLTLTHDGESVELNASDFIEGNNYNHIFVNGSAQGKALDNIEQIEINSVLRKYRSQYCYIKLKGSSSNIRNVAAYLGDDGRFNFSWQDKDGTIHAYEMVYFYADRYIILTDGTDTYFYTK